MVGTVWQTNGLKGKVCSLLILVFKEIILLLNTDYSPMQIFFGSFKL